MAPATSDTVFTARLEREMQFGWDWQKRSTIGGDDELCQGRQQRPLTAPAENAIENEDAWERPWS